MAFLYDILYSNVYPFKEPLPQVSGIIQDITLYTTSAYCTDIYISDELLLLSFVLDNQEACSVNVENPLTNVLYPVYNNGEVCGTVSLNSIPQEKIVMSNIHAAVSDKCLLLNDAGTYGTNLSTIGIEGNNIKINTAGSIKSTVTSHLNSTYIHIIPQPDIFDIFDINLAADIAGASEYDGFTDIHGVMPDAKGNINIIIEGYDITPIGYVKNSNGEQEQVINGLQITAANKNTLIGCNTPDIYESITCSISDGAAVSYPLDKLICSEDTVVCPPEWDQNEEEEDDNDNA